MCVVRKCLSHEDKHMSDMGENRKKIARKHIYLNYIKYGLSVSLCGVNIYKYEDLIIQTSGKFTE